MKIKKFLAVALVSALTSSSWADGGLVSIRSANGKIMKAVAGQVIVKYKSGRGSAGRISMAGQYKISTGPNLRALNADVLQVPPGQSIESFIEQIKSNPDVEAAEPNGIYHAYSSTNPDDPLKASQYYLDKIDMPDAWLLSTGSATIVVAVVDTGVTLTHPDLSASLWTNPNPSGNSGLHGTRIEIDANGDGDCVDTITNFGPEQCASSDPTDDNNDSSTYHGTHVAGIIAAQTDNGLFISGIAQNCKIMAVKSLNSQGSGTFTSIAEGITYAVNNGARVINLSLGGDTGSSLINAAIDNAIAHNVVVVAASGNDGGAVNQPAAYSPVIAVGATDSSDVIASFSSRGPEVDLVAPGVGILSTTNVGTSTEDGTSFAAPMVSAVAALALSLNPSLTPAQLTRYFDFNADDKGAGGYDTTYGFGRLNAFRVLEAVNGGTNYISSPAEPNETVPGPNPYNPTLGSNVTFYLPQSLGQENIEIRIFNVAGEEVKKLTGTNLWNGKNDDGSYVASGLYYYYAKTSAGNAKGKITVIK